MKREKLLPFIIVLAILITAPVYADVLKLGSEGDAVKEVQRILIKEGYLNSEATGYYGDMTVEAVKKFQEKRKLKVDGIVGKDTLCELQKIGTSTSDVKEYSEEVEKIQKALNGFGYYDSKIDGIHGPLTDLAIKAFQEDMGLVVDGIVGKKTADVLFNLNLDDSGEQSVDIASRGNVDRKEETGKESTYGEMLDWWTEVVNVFPRGTEAKIIDFKTGKSFNIIRTYGGNHADCETLTKEDSKIMKELWGGKWSWDRRPVIVVVGDRKIAASMIGMPHAGLDAKEANIYVKGRSGGFGNGTNLDTVKGNGIDGHFCVHFLNSRTHGTNKVDDKHQANIKIAAGK